MGRTETEKRGEDGIETQSQETRTETETETEQENRTDQNRPGHTTEKMGHTMDTQNTQSAITDEDIRRKQETESRNFLDSIRTATVEIQMFMTLETLGYTDQETLRSLDSQLWDLVQDLGDRRV